MRIYIPEPKGESQIRVRIEKQSKPSVNFILKDCTLDEVYTFINTFMDKLSYSEYLSFVLCKIHLREYQSGNIGKCKTISFIGVTPEKAFGIFKQELGLIKRKKCKK